MDRATDQTTDVAAPEDSDGGLDEVDVLRRELADTVDKWRRSAADVANLQKRFQRELDRGRVAERDRVLIAWVATVDDLDRALAHADASRSELVEGLRAVLRQAVTAIESFGSPRFGAVGDVFDPALHDVVSTIPANREFTANVVAAVVKAGYGTVDHLLRPATVVVAKGPD